MTTPAASAAATRLAAAPGAAPAVPAAHRSRARFEEVIARVLRHEDAGFDPVSPTGGGRVVNHPADPGGHTRLGITLQTLRDFRNEPGLGLEALELLSLAEIKEIYYTRYWLPIRADELPVGLDYAVFDFAVNSGPRRAAIGLQVALGAATGQRVAADGIIGPQTVGVARGAADLAAVIDNLSEYRLEFLRRLSIFGTFGRGWTRRVREVQEVARDDARRGPAPLTVREAADTRSVQATGVLAGVLAVATAIFEHIRQVLPLLEGLPMWAAVTVVAVVALGFVIQWRRRAGE